MAWTAEHRRAEDRRGLRYLSDLTDAEWALVAPLMRPAKHGGRPRKVDGRELLNVLFYVLSAGCQGSALPEGLPPKSTVSDYFTRWEWEGILPLSVRRLVAAAPGLPPLAQKTVA
jgi:transposase